MARGRSHKHGDHRLGKTTTVLAGTTIQGKNGDTRTLDYDTVLPLDCVGDDSVILGGESWSIIEEAWGWTEADY